MKFRNLIILLLEISLYISAFGITDYYMDVLDIQPLHFYLPLFFISIFFYYILEK